MRVLCGHVREGENGRGERCTKGVCSYVTGRRFALRSTLSIFSFADFDAIPLSELNSLAELQARKPDCQAVLHCLLLLGVQSYEITLTTKTQLNRLPFDKLWLETLDRMIISSICVIVVQIVTDLGGRSACFDCILSDLDMPWASEASKPYENRKRGHVGAKSRKVRLDWSSRVALLSPYNTSPQKITSHTSQASYLLFQSSLNLPVAA